MGVELVRRYLAQPRNTLGFILESVLIGAAAAGVAAAAAELVHFALVWIVAEPDAIPMRELDDGPIKLFFNAVVFAPLLETLICRWLWRFMTRWCRLPIALIGSSVLAGIAHGPYPVTFAATTCSFFVFALAWLRWRNVSTSRSYWAPVLAHATSNAILILPGVLLAG